MGRARTDGESQRAATSLPWDDAEGEERLDGRDVRGEARDGEEAQRGLAQAAGKTEVRAEAAIAIAADGPGCMSKDISV